MLKDFDITQINKDTKIVVFKVPFCEYHECIDLLNDNLKSIHDQLGEIGVKAIFIDDLIAIEPLTDELLSASDLKTF